MQGLTVRLSLASAAVAAALGIPSAPAGAAVYGGFFDPVTFSGSFTIDVDDDCLSSSGFKPNSGITITPGDGFCSASLTSASALVVDSGGPPPNYNGTLGFAPPAISSPGSLFGVFIVSDGGGGYTLDSFDTALLPALSESPYDGANEWDIQFASGERCDGPCGTPVIGAGPIFNPPRGVYLFANGLLADTAQYTDIRRIDLNGIPEPSSLALLLGALGAGLFARRRPKAAESPS